MKRPAPEKWEAPALWLGLALALAAATGTLAHLSGPWPALRAASAAWAAAYLYLFPHDA